MRSRIAFCSGLFLQIECVKGCTSAWAMIIAKELPGRTLSPPRKVRWTV